MRAKTKKEDTGWVVDWYFVDVILLVDVPAVPTLVRSTKSFSVSRSMCVDLEKASDFFLRSRSVGHA